MSKMFCFQCEQTAKCTGCTVQGVCGKKAETSNLQDELTSKVIELANCSEPSSLNTQLIIEALFTTITNVNFDDNSIKSPTNDVAQRIKCGSNFNVESVWECDEDLRSLKSLILCSAERLLK